MNRAVEALKNLGVGLLAIAAVAVFVVLVGEAVTFLFAGPQSHWAQYLVWVPLSAYFVYCLGYLLRGAPASAAEAAEDEESPGEDADEVIR